MVLPFGLHPFPVVPIHVPFPCSLPRTVPSRYTTLRRLATASPSLLRFVLLRHKKNRPFTEPQKGRARGLGEGTKRNEQTGLPLKCYQGSGCRFAVFTSQAPPMPRCLGTCSSSSFKQDMVSSFRAVRSSLFFCCQRMKDGGKGAKEPMPLFAQGQPLCPAALFLSGALTLERVSRLLPWCIRGIKTLQEEPKPDRGGTVYYARDQSRGTILRWHKDERDFLSFFVLKATCFHALCFVPFATDRLPRSAPKRSRRSGMETGSRHESI